MSKNFLWTFKNISENFWEIFIKLLHFFATLFTISKNRFFGAKTCGFTTYFEIGIFHQHGASKIHIPFRTECVCDLYDKKWSFYDWGTFLNMLQQIFATFSHFSWKFMIFPKYRSCLEACWRKRTGCAPKILQKMLLSTIYLKVCKFSFPQKHISEALKIRIKISPNIVTT